MKAEIKDRFTLELIAENRAEEILIDIWTENCWYPQKGKTTICNGAVKKISYTFYPMPNSGIL